MPPIEATVTTFPDCCGIMARRTTSWVVKKTPFSRTSIWRRQSSSGKLLGPVGGEDSGAVDEDVDAPVFGEHGVDQGGAGVRPADVELYGPGAVPLRPQARGGFFPAVRNQLADDHPRPLAGQGAGDAESYPLAGAGDDGCPVLEHGLRLRGL